MTKYTVKYTSQFKKDYKLAKKRNLDLDSLKIIVDKLTNDEPLDEKYRDHALGGDWKNYRECHIQPDWLLIYRKEEKVLVLVLTRTGTHSDLFNK